MHKILEKLPKEFQKKLEWKRQSDTIFLMLATLTENYFSDPDWIFEPKLDGERCLLYKKNKTVKMISRNQKFQDCYYPEIRNAIACLLGNFILDSPLCQHSCRL